MNCPACHEKFSYSDHLNCPSCGIDLAPQMSGISDSFQTSDIQNLYGEESYDDNSEDDFESDLRSMSDNKVDLYGMDEESYKTQLTWEYVIPWFRFVVLLSFLLIFLVGWAMTRFDGESIIAILVAALIVSPLLGVFVSVIVSGLYRWKLDAKPDELQQKLNSPDWQRAGEIARREYFEEEEG